MWSVWWPVPLLADIAVVFHLTCVHSHVYLQLIPRSEKHSQGTVSHLLYVNSSVNRELGLNKDNIGRLLYEHSVMMTDRVFPTGCFLPVGKLQRPSNWDNILKTFLHVKKDGLLVGTVVSLTSLMRHDVVLECQVHDFVSLSTVDFHFQHLPLFRFGISTATDS